MKRIRVVQMGEWLVGSRPEILTTDALGSCVALAFYEPGKQIGGLAHVMLPGRAAGEGNVFEGQAFTMIDNMVSYLCGRGILTGNLVAKIAGGANMFPDSEGARQSLGAQIVSDIKTILRFRHIPLIAEETGGSHGRSVEFHLDSGMLIVRAIGKESIVC